MLDREKAVLAVVDIQDVLMPRPESEETHLFLRQSAKLIQCAKTLDIPLLVTEQNPAKLGGTHAGIAEILGESPRIPKLEFGCMANPEFLAAFGALKRPQIIIIGMETHICVMQTALGALEGGYEVFVVQDAVASMDPVEREAGLVRMRRTGVTLVTVQMAIFELLRAAGTPEFRAMLPYLK